MRRPVRPRLAASFVALVLLGATARAQVLEQSFTVHVPPQAPPFQASIDVPRFDPSLGTLIEARLQLTPHVGGQLRAENTDPASPYAVTLTFTSAVVLSNGACTVVAQSSGYVSQYLMPFDGTTDFTGTSGMTQSVQDDQTTFLSIVPPSRDFDEFVSTIGGSATMPFAVDVMALPQCDPLGDPAILFETRIAAGPEIRVTYLYTTHGAPFCAGDGSAGACPCGNYGSAGHGCASPGSIAGAILLASGEPIVSADTFSFLASDLPPSTVVALIQGDENGIGGTPFGAGLSCVSGSVLRIATKVTGQSAILGGTSEGMPISVAGTIPPSGGTRYYQVMFRDLPSACNASTVNFTNGWRVTWRP
jgi:hypothetical protein